MEEVREGVEGNAIRQKKSERRKENSQEINRRTVTADIARSGLVQETKKTVKRKEGQSCYPRSRYPAAGGERRGGE